MYKNSLVFKYICTELYNLYLFYILRGNIMSFTKQFKETMRKVFKKSKDENYDYRSKYQQRLIEFRKMKNTVNRLEKPTNLARAKELGYKAKQGVVVVLVKTRRGSGLFRQPNAGRRPKRMGFKKLTRNISIQRMAEEKASKKYLNCEVVNSYLVGEDGHNKYFEVILASKNQPEVQKDKELKKVIKKSGRTERGLTSVGKKNRGLRKVPERNKK